MEPLYKKHCEACRADAPLVSQKEARELLENIPSWRKEFHEGVEKLIRVFKFAAYKDGVEFASKVAELADRENHHPALLVEWGKVTVYWWTHKIKGLHLNDFVMAAKTDMIAGQSEQS